MRPIGLAAIVLLFLSSPGEPGPEKPSPEKIAAAKKTVAELIQDVHKAKDEVRLAAVQALADRGPKAKEAIPALIAAMHSLNEDLRLNAALALSAIGKPAVPALAKALESKENEARFYAAWALGWIGPAAQPAVPSLLRALADPDEDVRRRAVTALAAVGGSADHVLPALLKMFNDPEADVREAAFTAAGKWGKAALPALHKALDDPALAVAVARALVHLEAEAAPAFAALCRVGRQHPELRNSLASIAAKSFPQAIGLLKDPDPEIRLTAFWAVSAADAKALPWLLVGARDPHREIRALAVGALGEPRFPYLKDVYDTLRHALADDDWYVRHNAVRALGNRGDNAKDILEKEIVKAAGRDKINLLATLGEHAGQPEALKKLIPELKNADFTLRYRAACVLAWPLKLPKEALHSLIAGLEKKDPAVRAEAAHILGWFPSQIDAALPALAAALEETAYLVRREVVLALTTAVKPARPATEFGSRADAKITLPALGRTLRDRDPLIRRAVLNALTTFGADAAPYLAEALKDGELRPGAIDALGKLGPAAQKAVPILRDLAKDPLLWGQVAPTLARLDAEGSFGPLLKLLQKHDAKVRQALQDAKPAAKTAREVAKALLASLDNPDAKVQARAGRTFLTLAIFLSDSDKMALADPWNRIAKTVWPQTLKALQKGTAEVRREAVVLYGYLTRISGVLGRPLPAPAINPLEAALTDPDAQVRYLARQAMRNQSPLPPPNP